MTETKRAALITGSGRNIGKATALRLAKDGFNVVINGSNDERACDQVAAEAEQFGIEAVVVMGDIGVESQANDIARQALEKFGTIDVLINNAAIRPAAGFLDISSAEWERVMAVDLTAAVWLSRACLPAMIKNNWGRIINFAGMNALQGYASRPHVSVAKHGAWGLTKALSKEFGAQGITTNIISPGPISSDHDDPVMRAHIESQVSRIPLGRLGDPMEVAATVSWLVSEPGAFVNGQLIQVNGGAQT